MTTLQILQAVRRKILETTSDIVTDATLLEYANQTDVDITRRAYPQNAVVTTTVTLTAGSGSLPSNFGTLYSDPMRDAYNVYPEMSPADFARNATQNASTVENGTTLKVYPTSVSSVTIRYYPTTTTLTTSQNPIIDIYFHELYIYGTMYRVLEDLQDEELSKYYKDKYETEFKLKRDGQSEYEEMAIRGGQMFNPIDIISDNGLSGSPNYF